MLLFAGAWLPLLLVCRLCRVAVPERAAVAGTFDHAGDRLILGLRVRVLGIAAFAAQPITSFDTGLYHFQSIGWLSKKFGWPFVCPRRVLYS